MPAMHFTLRWPDASETRCYSPSLIVKDYLDPGRDYPLPELLRRSREMLNIASDRVRAKYGFACSMAMDELARIEDTAARFASDARVAVLHFDE